MKRIIKEQVQAQVSKIMPKIEKYVTESLEAEVLVKLTNQPQTSYAIAASLSEFEFKKILIDKMEENKSINITDIQKNLYNGLDEDPSAGSNRGSKRRRSGKETESSKEQTHKESKSTSSSKGASRSQPKSSSKSTQAEEHEDASQWNPPSSPTPDHEWHKTKTADKRQPQLWISQLAQATCTQSSFNYKPLPLIQNERGRQVIPWDYFINNDLEYLKGGSSSQKYTTSITKTKAADYGYVKWIEYKKFYGYASNMESSKDVYSRHRIIAVTSLKIMKYFGYSHLEEVIVRRQDDQLYT
ncbi:hypothetical protein Tco_0836039 [Tanacetum coccineum]